MNKELTTTLAKIKQYGPCPSSWKTLLAGLKKTEADDETLPLLKILEINGIEDAMWSLRASDCDARIYVLFACQCARNVLDVFGRDHPDDNRPLLAIEIAEQHVWGAAMPEAARAAMPEAAWATGTAAWAAGTAEAAARAAEIEGKTIKNIFESMCKLEGDYGRISEQWKR